MAENIQMRNTVGDEGIVVAICDDNQQDREKYAHRLLETAKQNGFQARVIFYESGSSALFNLEDQKELVDILYMDVGMPGEDGVAISRKIRELKNDSFFNGEIIFLTGNSYSMLEAFDVQAFHYIIKGVTKESKFDEIFLAAVNKVRRKKRKQLLLRGVGEYRNVDIDSIWYFEVVHRIITVHYGIPERTFSFYCSMEKLENILLPFHFMRVHKSFIVQVDFISELSNRQILLQNKAVVPVGRTYSAQLKQAVDNRVSNQG